MKQKNPFTPVKRLVAVFMLALFVSGLTAIPLETELNVLLPVTGQSTALHTWLQKILDMYKEASRNHPVLFYGYDWLAFAHFILALLFYGVYRDPVKNTWVVQFGLLACVLVLPYAFIAGHFRGIPIGWRLIDCSFSVFGFVLLWSIYQKIKKLPLDAPASRSSLLTPQNQAA